MFLEIVCEFLWFALAVAMPFIVLAVMCGVMLPFIWLILKLWHWFFP